MEWPNMLNLSIRLLYTFCTKGAKTKVSRLFYIPYTQLYEKFLQIDWLRAVDTCMWKLQNLCG